MSKKEKKKLKFYFNYPDDIQDFVVSEGFQDHLRSEIIRLNPPKESEVMMYYMGDVLAYKATTYTEKRGRYYVSVERISVNQCSEEVLAIQESAKKGGNGKV